MTRLGVTRYDTITADSAEQKSNEDLRVLGWRVVDAKKGADSIRFGIGIMQELEINITKRSANLIDEFRRYTWSVDRDGGSTNKPIDKYNHGIDAIRYHFQTNMADPDAPRFAF
jgi:phage terminase large subunit